MDWLVFLELLHLAIQVRVDYIRELDALLLGHNGVEAPSVFRRTHRHGIAGETYLPLFSKFRLSVEVKESIEVLDYPSNSFLYLLWVEFQFLNQPVNLVNVENRPDAFF